MAGDASPGPDARAAVVTSTRRIVVFSASFGGGHRSAAAALEAYLRGHYGDSVDLRVLDFFGEFAPGLNVLAKFAYQQSVQFFPELYGTFFDLTKKLPDNPVVSEIAQVGYANAKAFMDRFEPDAVVSVFPVAGGVVSDIKSGGSSVVSATVITDYGTHKQWLHPATDLYFVASKEVREDLVLRGVPWERVVVSGIPIDERFSTRSDKRTCRKELGLADRFTVLMTAAAGTVSDVKSIAEEVAGAGVQVVAVAGRNERLRRRLQTLEKRTPLVRVFGSVDNMDRIMASADVLVGKAGGLTVSEALATGLPLIIFNPVPGQEVFNADFLVNYGAGLAARDEEDAAEKVRFLSTHPGRLAQMSENAASLGKPGSTQAVCERLLAAIH